jgi:AraC-like DNA-binding protein
MSYCPLPIGFSMAHSEKRMAKASQTLGDAVVKRILAFALFLMGARREDISQYLTIPSGTLFSLLTRIGRMGLPAMEDRRRKHSGLLPPPVPREPSIEITSNRGEFLFEFGSGTQQVTISDSNPLQVKTFLLTLLQNGLLTCSQVSRHLHYSSTHTARISRQLAENDVSVLLDKRKGHQRDYRVTPAVKAELIQQFVLDLISAGQTSGSSIAEGLKQRCDLSISARTVRYHLAELGLSKIKHSLPELVAAVKKTPKTDPQHEASAAGIDRV